MLLFYVEITDKLQTAINTNVGVLKQCAELLIKELPNRFPISEEMIIAALCDPCSQHLPLIDKLLNEKNHTRISFLTEFCQKNDIPTVIGSSNSNSNGGSSTNSVLKTLFRKHINTNASTSNNLENEIAEFKKLSVDLDSDFNSDLILSFWMANEKHYPIMSQIAKRVLFITTSNAKSESAFSSSGCLINQKRATLNPLKAEKVLLIYHNIWLTEET